MADCADADIPWEFCRTSPERKKIKKGSKRDKKRQRDKSDDASLKENGDSQRKKKKVNSKFKEASQKKKKKKKEKKEKKMRALLEADFMFTEDYDAPDLIAQGLKPKQKRAVKPKQKRAVKPASSSLHGPASSSSHDPASSSSHGPASSSLHGPASSSSHGPASSSSHGPASSSSHGPASSSSHGPASSSSHGPASSSSYGPASSSSHGPASSSSHGPASYSSHGPASSSSHGLAKPKPDQVTCDLLPKKKTKKKVAFDLSYDYKRAKRPKLVLPSTQLPQPEDDIPLETMTGQSQGPLQDNDSQCTGDDMNSQDLFITQKTFRVSPSETSSGETYEEGIAATSLMLTGQDRGSPLPRRRSDAHLPDSQAKNKLPHFHQNRLLNVDTLPADKVLHPPSQDPKKANTSLQVEVQANLTKETKVSRLKRVKPKVVYPHLEQPMVVNLDGSKPPQDCTSNQKIQKSPPCFGPFLSRPMSNTSTQTENFYTTELSVHLRFYQQSRETISSEDLKPMDLSLPQRARADFGRHSAIETKDGDDGRGDQKPSSSLVEIKEPHGQRPWSCAAQVKAETTPSPQSESEPKSSDTTISSEDSDWRSSKDLTQVKVVQMRLNESFFFKQKGEGRSSKPESPLMKLAQGRETRSRKQH